MDHVVIRGKAEIYSPIGRRHRARDGFTSSGQPQPPFRDAGNSCASRCASTPSPDHPSCGPPRSSAEELRQGDEGNSPPAGKRSTARASKISEPMHISRYNFAMAEQTMNSWQKSAGASGLCRSSALVVASHPMEGLDRIHGRVEIVLSEHLSSVAGQKPSATTVEPVRNLHELLGVDWPCPLEGGFKESWSDLARHMDGAGLKVGEGHDADSNLAHVVWCAIRHMDPQRVLETGVARGVTSVLALGAMAQSNGGGRLWSIDLPPMMSGWHEQSKVLVDETAWPDWTYIRGSSRRTLVSTCTSMDSIDIFVHDSLHTPQTMKYEFEKAWPFMRTGALLICDDVEGNSAFVDFVDSRATSRNGSPLRRRAKKGCSEWRSSRSTA